MLRSDNNSRECTPRVIRASHPRASTATVNTHSTRDSDFSPPRNAHVHTHVFPRALIGRIFVSKKNAPIRKRRVFAAEGKVFFCRAFVRSFVSTGFSRKLGLCFGTKKKKKKWKRNTLPEDYIVFCLRMNSTKTPVKLRNSYFKRLSQTTVLTTAFDFPSRCNVIPIFD